jgi:hypothetical protein
MYVCIHACRHFICLGDVLLLFLKDWDKERKGKEGKEGKARKGKA